MRDEIRADSSCQTGKEQTIRLLVGDCQKAQMEIQVQLDRNFERNTPELCKNAPTAKRPNVLDEIMDGLRVLNEEQKQTIKFIIEKINPKI